MGKEWYWASKSSKRGVAEVETQTQRENPSGCMCAFFQFFDFHPFHFPTINNQQQQQTTFNSASYIQENHNTIPKGAEAPRNSLESEGGTILFPSKEENLKIPKSMQIKTSRGTKTMTNGGNLNDLSNSPGIKTPTLVARLMGLDLLPHSPSSSPSSSTCNTVPNLHHHLRPKQHIQTKPRNSIDSEIGTTRSLPETPRISLARRSDVEYHHRLSLQINKENNTVLGEDLDLPKSSLFSKRRYDENNSISPSHYARQIVKQVKESVARKVGQDITNTLKSKEQTKEENLGQLRIKKSSKTSEHSNSKYNNNNNKHKQSTTTSQLIPKDQNQTTQQQPQLPRVLTKPKPSQQALLPYQQELQKQKSVPKCKKVSNEIFNSRIKRPPQTTDIIRNKQEESFIIIRSTSSTRVNDIKPTKSKKTRSLSSNLHDNINSVPNLLPVKTDPSPPATKIPQKQVSVTQESKRISQLSGGWSHKYKQEGVNTLANREIRKDEEDNPNGTSSIIIAQDHIPEFQYITEVLSRTITTTKTLCLSQCFSLTHPLYPSIVNQLEEHNNDKGFNFTAKHQLGNRWNRKLLFELVDEVLLEMIKPRKCKKKLWYLDGCCWYQGNVEGLVRRVWKRIEKFPCAKCEVLEDIDGLIKSEDMEKVKVESEEGLEEEGEKLVAEIEGNIWDKLLHETIMAMNVSGKGFTSMSSPILNDCSISCSIPIKF